MFDASSGQHIPDGDPLLGKQRGSHGQDPDLTRHIFAQERDKDDA
jgi:hypothetical protein